MFNKIIITACLLGILFLSGCTKRKCEKIDDNGIIAGGFGYKCEFDSKTQFIVGNGIDYAYDNAICQPTPAGWVYCKHENCDGCNIINAT